MHTGKNWKCCQEYNGETKEIKMLKGKHYAKLVCAKCGHYIKWISNPNITQECKDRENAINKLMIKYENELTEKQKGFLNNVKLVRFMTPLQSSYLSRILLKFSS
jgi:hypothetical protein